MERSLYQQMSQERAKKLVSVFGISMFVTDDSKEAILISDRGLEQVMCI